MTGQPSHYETLGLRADATATEIRDAYRRLARRHHPDQGAADAEAMPRINEAYRVLGDPARRASYDAALTATSVPARTVIAREPVRAAVDLTPARIPWRLMVFMAGVGIAIVLVGAALYEPAGPARPDNLLESGSCVSIEVNGDAREVSCSGDAGELVVEVLVPTGEPCPDGSAAHRDRQGRGVACVRSIP